MPETILQHWVLVNFAYPFLLLFFIVFGILEKTEVFGSGKKQLNALIAFIIGLIFISFINPKLVVANLILFLTVAVVVMFVALLLWGFISGKDGLQFKDANKGLKYFIGIVIVIAVILATLWALGVQGSFFDFLFRSSWSEEFITNIVFIAVVIIAMVAIIRGGKSSS
ncbi:MAG: hypothetical protein AABX79_02885 [Nanoarchaeota archaeon]